MKTAINTDIRKKAKKGIDRASDTTVKMILAILEVEEKEQAAFVIEMQRRIDDYEQGKVKTISLDEFEKRIRSKRKKGVQSLK